MKKSTAAKLGSPECFKPSPELLIKLGSAIAHLHEGSGPRGHPFDMIEAKKLLEDAEVVTWMKQMHALALLPVARS